ncbi:MAG: carbohydrate kinase [Leptolyngbyaceae cyanobacterium bins.349]|nr:carbohydrate kinase [Leptolyngbyaceae cyanobacterium bins.349]
MIPPRVLCLGEILFDFLSDQPGVPYDQVTAWTPYPGGAPANVATALTKLGTPSGFIGCVGQDGSGDQLVHFLDEIGVNTDGIQRHPQAPTRGVYVVRSAAGDRAFAGFGTYDTTEFADTHLNAAHLPVKLFETAEFLVLGSLEMAYPASREATLHALSLADQYFTKVFLDVNWRPVFWPNPDAAPAVIRQLIKHTDFLKLSDEEAEWLFDTSDPGVIAHRLETVEAVLVTAGEKGCAYCINEYEGKLPAFAMPVVDTTGAGDSFSAGFLHQLCQQGLSSLTVPEYVAAIVRYASAVGALTITQAGAIAAQPTATAVEAFLERRQD